jgi:hypothetical protein
MATMALVLSGKRTDFITVFKDPINLTQNKKYEAALLSIDTYNSFPNISSDDKNPLTVENNIFKYSTDDGSTWKIITFDTGSYQLADINNEIQRQMVINGDYDNTNKSYYITITANISTLNQL